MEVYIAPKERQQCINWWHKFRTLDIVRWISLIAAGAVGHYRWPNQAILLMLSGIFVVCTLWLYRLNCPVCGATFSGGWLQLLNRFHYVGSCYGCGLSRAQLKRLEAGEVG